MNICVGADRGWGHLCIGTVYEVVCYFVEHSEVGGNHSMFEGLPLEIEKHAGIMV